MTVTSDIVVAKDTMINKTRSVPQGAHILVGEAGMVYDKLCGNIWWQQSLNLMLRTTKFFQRRQFQNGSLKEDIPGQEK